LRDGFDQIQFALNPIPQSDQNADDSIDGRVRHKNAKDVLGGIEIRRLFLRHLPISFLLITLALHNSSIQLFYQGEISR
jgi:hypothetical protein